MRPSGTEPGDFIEFDMDLIEADRRQRLRNALEAVRPALEDEIGVGLQVDNVGNQLVLADGSGTRFTATIGPNGRVIVTDQRANDVL